VPIKDQPKLIEIGKAEVIQNFSNNRGRKVALFPLGNMMSLARKAAVQLTAAGYDIAIVNPRFVKPLDAGTTQFFGSAADVVVTLEDHVLMGGYGSAVLELFNEKRITTPVIQIGWPDQFIEHATSVDDLRKKYGLTVENLINKVKQEFSEAAPATPQMIEFA
jgi:1-deoxy-D-xylulose-5-phosphate synthase